MNLKHAVVVTAVVAFAERAAACPGCVDPKAQNTTAMLVSTAFMSIVPLIFLFSVAYWVYRKDKAATEAAAVDNTPAE